MPYTPKTNWRANDIVTPDDLNRMERGISEASSPADDLILFVSPLGNDSTGTGDITKPFRTIQKAIDSFPTSNNLGKLCVIKVIEGVYSGFTLSSHKRIEVSVDGDVQILGDIIINAGSITFVDETDAQVYLIGGQVVMAGGSFISMIPVGITVEGQSGKLANAGVDCSSGSTFSVHADLIITNHETAIKCSHSHITLKRMLTDQTTTGIVCECGIVQLGDDVIQASTKFVTQHGGRIYVGAQTKMPDY